MMKLSIIIPVYNTAKYLRKCLDSVLAAASTLKVKVKGEGEQWSDSFSVEVICVDDGSTDGSGEILEEYREKKVKIVGQGQELPTTNYQLPTIRVIHQANAGVSAARNAALDVATGEWVVMLDPDDYWKEDLLSRCFEKIGDEPDCDAVCFGMVKVKESGEEIGAFGREDCPSGVTTGEEILRDGRGPKSKVIWSSCDKLFRRSVIEAHHLRYLVGLRNGEDSLFSQLFFSYAGKVVLAPEIDGYCYLMHDASVIHRKFTEVPTYELTQFEQLHSVWRKTRSAGLACRLAYLAAGLPYLGKESDYIAAGVRPKGIDFLLGSKVFSGSVIPFMIIHGTSKSRAFALAYVFLPNFFRRKLLALLA